MHLMQMKVRWWVLRSPFLELRRFQTSAVFMALWYPRAVSISTCITTGFDSDKENVNDKRNPFMVQERATMPEWLCVNRMPKLQRCWPWLFTLPQLPHIAYYSRNLKRRNHLLCVEIHHGYGTVLVEGLPNWSSVTQARTDRTSMQASVISWGVIWPTPQLNRCIDMH